MNEKEYYRRIPSHLRPEILRQRHALIIGQGSGGSRAAIELGRLGISLMLVDRPGECLEEHNILRHPLGYDSLGKTKVTEVKRHIANLNPATTVATVEMDVTISSAEFNDLVKSSRPDLILACTDSQPSKHAIDAVAVRHGIPTVGAGVYDGGIGGEVYVTGPSSACYGCIASAMNLDVKSLAETRSIDYNNLNLEEIRSTCALNLDIEQIALIQVRVALGILMGDTDVMKVLPPECNLVVFSNRSMPAPFDRPWHAKLFAFERNPACLNCGVKADEAETEALRILKHLT